MFDLGNNVDHACLRITNTIKVTIVDPLPNHLDGLDGELITPIQVLVKEMAISYECDDDDADEHFWSFDLEGTCCLPSYQGDIPIHLL